MIEIIIERAKEQILNHFWMTFIIIVVLVLIIVIFSKSMGDKGENSWQNFTNAFGIGIIIVVFVFLALVFLESTEYALLKEGVTSISELF